MKTLNKILPLVILIIIFCGICLSCVRSRYAYRVDEDRDFMNKLEDEEPIAGFEDFLYDNAYIFVSLEDGNSSSYWVGVDIFQESSDIPKFEIEHILITDEFGTIIFEDINLSLEDKEIYIFGIRNTGEYISGEKEYFRFSFWLKTKQDILPSELPDEFYYASITVNGRTIQYTLNPVDYVGINWPT